MYKLLFIATLLVATSSLTAQDLKLPSLSPGSKLTQDFSAGTIEIEYSRPSIRGRTVFGDLVPFGKVWRTGANKSTKITFSEDVIMGGTAIPAGSYSFYTVPDKDSWEIILNKNTGNWGAMGYDKKDDVVRFQAKPQTLPSTVETFTISTGNITATSCDIYLMWENTFVGVSVTVDNNDKIVKSIEKAVDNPSIPYRDAALYYVQTDQKLDKALEYVGKALEQNDEAYWNHLLMAQIAAKLSKNDVAKAHVKRARELTKGKPAEAGYMTTTQEVLDSLN